MLNNFNRSISEQNEIFLAAVAKFWSFLENLANEIVCSFKHFCLNKVVSAFGLYDKNVLRASRGRDAVLCDGLRSGDLYFCLIVAAMLPFFVTLVFRSFLP